MMPLNHATPAFEKRYANHLKHLQHQGLQPKTVDAYARAIRRVAIYVRQRVISGSKSDESMRQDSCRRPAKVIVANHPAALAMRVARQQTPPASDHVRRLAISSGQTSERCFLCRLLQRQSGLVQQPDRSRLRAIYPCIVRPHFAQRNPPAVLMVGISAVLIATMQMLRELYE